MSPEPCPARGLGRVTWGHMCGGQPAGELWVPPGSGAWLLPGLGSRDGWHSSRASPVGRACFSAGPGAAGQGEEPMDRVGAAAAAQGQASSAHHPAGGCRIWPGQAPHPHWAWGLRAPPGPAPSTCMAPACPVPLALCSSAAGLACQRCGVRGWARPLPEIERGRVGRNQCPHQAGAPPAPAGRHSSQGCPHCACLLGPVCAGSAVAPCSPSCVNTGVWAPVGRGCQDGVGTCQGQAWLHTSPAVGSLGAHTTP